MPCSVVHNCNCVRYGSSVWFFLFLPSFVALELHIYIVFLHCSSVQIHNYLADTQLCTCIILSAVSVSCFSIWLFLVLVIFLQANTCILFLSFDDDCANSGLVWWYSALVVFSNLRAVSTFSFLFFPPLNSVLSRSLMAKRPVTPPLVEVMMHSTLFLVRLVLESMSLVLCLLIWNLLWLMKWGVELTANSSTQSSLSVARRMLLTTLPVAIIPVISPFFNPLIDIVAYNVSMRS